MKTICNMVVDTGLLIESNIKHHYWIVKYFGSNIVVFQIDISEHNWKYFSSHNPDPKSAAAFCMKL